MSDPIINKFGYYISSNVYSVRRTPTRRVNCYELELYTTSTNISVINGIEYDQKRGNVLVSRPGDIRYSIGPFECHCVHFTCSDTELTRVLEKLPAVFRASNFEILGEYFKKLSDSARIHESANDIYMRGILLELIALIITEANTKQDGRYKSYASEVEAACEYMQRSLEQKITLEDIAASVNLSGGFFHKVFKSIKGKTPAEYLCELRLARAKSLLSETSMPISEIAIVCGFGSQAYLNYVFGKYLSQTPKKFRDTHKLII